MLTAFLGGIYSDDLFRRSWRRHQSGTTPSQGLHADNIRNTVDCGNLRNTNIFMCMRRTLLWVSRIIVHLLSHKQRYPAVFSSPLLLLLCFSLSFSYTVAFLWTKVVNVGNFTYIMLRSTVTEEIQCARAETKLMVSNIQRNAVSSDICTHCQYRWSDLDTCERMPDDVGGDLDTDLLLTANKSDRPTSRGHSIRETRRLCSEYQPLLSFSKTAVV